MLPAALPGLGLYLAGTAMDAYGQHQGAKAMEAQLARELADEEAARREQNALVQAELGRMEGVPLGRVAGKQARLNSALYAVQPAAPAAGKALGLGKAGTSRALAPLLPRLARQAQAGAMSAEEEELARRQAALAGGLQSSRENQELMRATYDTGRQAASMRGGVYRQMGGTMQQIGPALAMLGASQAAPAAAPTTYVPPGAALPGHYVPPGAALNPQAAASAAPSVYGLAPIYPGLIPR